MAKGGVNWERVARASLHPTRVQILDALAKDGGRALSPNGLSKELGEALGNVSYHVTQLVTAGLLTLVETVPRRGALEHYYRLADD